MNDKRMAESDAAEGPTEPVRDERRPAGSSHLGRLLITVGAVALLTLGVVLISWSGLTTGPASPAPGGPAGGGPVNNPLTQAVGNATQILPAAPHDLGTILFRLALASLLGLAISFRGSRQQNELLIVHTNMIIAFTGAMMMIIVGSDLARAFGLVGASSIVRYRTPVRDPKALASLFVSMGAGIAVGVGLYELAILGAIMVIMIEFALERGGPFVSRGRYRPERAYELTIETDSPVETLKAIEQQFEAARVSHTLMNYDRGKKQSVEMGLLVGVPMGSDIEKLTLQMLSAGARSVSWRLAKES